MQFSDIKRRVAAMIEEADRVAQVLGQTVASLPQCASDEGGKMGNEDGHQ